jgi:hypothetical protein
MRRIGFRRALPLLFTVVHVCFVWSARSVESQALSVTYQEGVGVPMRSLEAPPLKPIQKMALVLEIPAMFLAILVGAVVLHQNENAWMYLSIALVPFLWYFIGRWLDGLLGCIARLRVPRILRGLLNVVAIFILGVSIAGLTPLYHHRTAGTYWVFTGLALWSCLCLAMMFSCVAKTSVD